MPDQDAAIQDALNATPDASYARLGEAFLAKERKIKQEMAVIALLWLVGCPILCSLTQGSDYGKPDEGFCGLPSYSISSSMTGLYPKILGSIMAPLFAVLVVQRTSGALCSNLKLGWIVRFSPLVVTDNKQKKNHDENTRLLAIKLWNDIYQIELLGYLAGACLIILVAFDAKDFLLTHLISSQVAFFCLFRQNHLIGKLGDDYKDLFPNWLPQHGYRIFRWGMIHFGIMWFIFLFYATLENRGRCDILMNLFGNASTMKKKRLLSVLLWFNEYAFCFLCVYTQLLQHYEFRLWEFAGATKMPYMAIVSRYSLWAAVEKLIYGSSDATVLLGGTEQNKAKAM